MLSIARSFSSYSVADIAAATAFYRGILGLEVVEDDSMTMPLLRINAPGAGEIMLYPKDDHQPATFTVLNFVVPDLEAAVDELTGRGVTFQSYADGPITTDDRGIVHGPPGPDIAWFTDPSGNILGLIQEA